MVIKRKDIFDINLTHYKILLTLNELNKRNKYPSPKGINFILQGIDNEDTSGLDDIITFGTLISLSNKRISFLVLTLFRHGLIKNIYSDKYDQSYLTITSKGQSFIEDYQIKHKIVFKKKIKKEISKKEIVEL